MIIVSDIQDAMMMKKKLMSVVRRSHKFGHSRATVLIELLDIIEDLDKNIERIDAQLDIELEAIIEKHNNVEQAA
tara:strand:- start:69 stop:293 length:225 start_codon:yes stop_codon:yes gene_type:complete